MKRNLSSFYGLNIILPADTEELALTLNGKKRRLKRTDFEKFAASLKLTSIQYSKAMDRIICLVEDNLSTVLSASFLPEDMREAIETLVSDRISRFR